MTNCTFDEIYADFKNATSSEEVDRLMTEIAPIVEERYHGPVGQQVIDDGVYGRAAQNEPIKSGISFCRYWL
jgi:hypothetical protein